MAKVTGLARCQVSSLDEDRNKLLTTAKIFPTVSSQERKPEQQKNTYDQEEIFLYKNCRSIIIV